MIKINKNNNIIMDTLMKASDMILTKSDKTEIIMRRDKAIKYYRLTEYVGTEFSKDPSTKVGALFLYPETLQILSMGYNGMPRGFDETKESRWVRPEKYKYTEHAERNAIYNAVSTGTALKDSICVTSMCPCCDCTRAIIQSGCKMVITRNIYNLMEKHPEMANRWKQEWDISIEMMTETGITLMMLNDNEIYV